MKVMFLPWGQVTHYFWLVPLAWAFRAAGDEVRVASQPGTADAIKRSGMSVTVVGEAYDFLSELKKVLGDGRRGMAAIREISSAIDDSREYAPAPDYLAQIRKRFLERRLSPYTKAAHVMADDVVQLARAWQPDLIVSDPIVMAAPLAARAAGRPWCTCNGDRPSTGGPASSRAAAHPPSCGPMTCATCTPATTPNPPPSPP